MRVRKLVRARNCSCFTAPSLLRISRATSLMLFSSTKRSTTTRRCSAGKVSTSRNSVARRSTSASSAVLACASSPLQSRCRPPVPVPRAARDRKSNSPQCETAMPQMESPATRIAANSPARDEKLRRSGLPSRRGFPPAAPRRHIRARSEFRKARQSTQDPSALLQSEAARPLLASEPSTSSPCGVVLHQG